MSPKIGPLAFAEDGAGPGIGMARPYSEATAREVDTEVKRIADECYSEAIRILTEHRSQLNDLSSALLKDDTLDEDRILSVTGIARQVTAGARDS